MFKHDALHQSRTILRERTTESLRSVLPVTAIMLVLCFTIAPMPSGVTLAFIAGAALLVVGMGLFTLGAETAMMPMGELTGAAMTRSKKLWFAVGTCLLVGFMITVSEPDLTVLANQVPMIPNLTLIATVALGVGVFMVIALLRILFRVRLRYLLLGFYALVFALMFLTAEDFRAVAFDSGGVTTGPMTVPFIMALGIGMSSIRSDRDAESDSFGLVALCSIGPILAVLLLGLLYKSDGGNYSAVVLSDVTNSRELFLLFTRSFPQYFGEIAVALLPICLYFGVMQICVFHLRGARLAKIAVGILYTYLGLVLFLTGVNVGFLPAGYALGQAIGGMALKWLLVPIGMAVGYFIVAAEPAVYVLVKRVEEITSGAVPARALNLALKIGVSISVGLAMIRVLTGISILWFVLPGYVIALTLMFFAPDLFVAVAFDAGGVASGPMTCAFLLPFAMGACEAVGGNAVAGAFGVVAMVAMTPLITIQLLGLFYRVKKKEEVKGADDIVEL